MPTSNHFEQDEFDQAPPRSTQEATVEDEPIARQTRGRIQHEQFVANEATDDGELESQLLTRSIRVIYPPRTGCNTQLLS